MTLFPRRPLATTLLDLTLTLTLTLTLPFVQAKVIDLSHPLDANTIYWPGMPGWNLTTVQQGFFPAEQHWLQFGRFSSGEHGGTHIDAPRHLFPGGYDVSEVPLENTIAQGVMIEAINEVLMNSTYAVTVEKLQSWEKANGRIPNRAGVLFNFGWSETRWPDMYAYLNTPTPEVTSTIRHPHLTVAAARWLIKRRNVTMVGMDTPSPDLPSTPGLASHDAILAGNRIILENVRMSRELPARGFTLHAAPLKSVGGSGIPTRIYAIVPDDGDDDDDHGGDIFVVGDEDVVDNAGVDLLARIRGN